MGKKDTEPYHYIDSIRYDILDMVPLDGKVIGSIGCGRAKTESVLISQGREVHGVDVSEEAINVAQKRITTARCVHPTERMPFDEGSLDGLILADILEHLPLAWKYLESYSKMLKPGGWIVISVPNMRYFPALYMFVIKGDWPECPLGIFDETHIQVMTHKRLSRWCDKAGFLRVKWRDCYDFRFIYRNIARIINLISLKLIRGFLVFEIQGVFRKK